MSPWYWGATGFFDGTPPSVKSTFLASANQAVFKRGKNIFGADDPAHHVFFLERGLVKIYHLARSGEITILWFCTSGELFGAGGVVGAPDQSVYAQSASASVVYTLPRSTYEKMLIEYPQLGINVIKLMGARLRIACDALVDKTTQNAEARVARILLRLARHWGDASGLEIRFEVKVTQQEIANMAGSCRQTVNSILKSFERNGLIRFEKRTLILSNRDALSTLMMV